MIVPRAAGGYFDPLGLASGDDERAFKLKTAELKHGRLAMIAFLGACIPAGARGWPAQFTVTADGVACASKALSYTAVALLVALEALTQAGFSEEQASCLSFEVLLQGSGWHKTPLGQTRQILRYGFFFISEA